MGAATELDYTRLQWGNAEVATLCTVAESCTNLGGLAQLKVSPHAPQPC